MELSKTFQINFLGFPFESTLDIGRSRSSIRRIRWHKFHLDFEFFHIKKLIFLTLSYFLIWCRSSRGSRGGSKCRSRGDLILREYEFINRLHKSSAIIRHFDRRRVIAAYCFMIEAQRMCRDPHEVLFLNFSFFDFGQSNRRFSFRKEVFWFECRSSWNTDFWQELRYHRIEFTWSFIAAVLGIRVRIYIIIEIIVIFRVQFARS